MLFFSLASGRIMDWFYSKRALTGGDDAVWMGPPIAGGGLITFLGLMSLSYAESVVVGFCCSLLVGGGAALFAIPSITVVQSWYSTNRATATGLAMAGSGLGNFVYAFVLSKLIVEFDEEGGRNGKTGEGGGCEGWRKTLRAEAFASFGLVIIGEVGSERSEQ